ncbi:hypothetical protein QTP88_005890 [Uroleucon formosanum]
MREARARHLTNNRASLNRAAFSYEVSIDHSNYHYVVIGSMNSVCSYCKALIYKNEANGLCCANGKMKLIPLDPPPEPLYSLVLGIGTDSKHFLANIQQYNNCFQMTSFGATNVVRENVMPTFKEIFDEELKVPRLSGHQTKRNNINANINQNPMEWFKITIFIPFLDHIIQELKSRFSDKFVKVIPLEGLIPIHKDSYSTEAILNAAMFYEQDLLSSSDLVLKAEINLWKTKWNKIETNIPHTAVTSLPYCEEYFPNIKIILQLFAMLPVSTATAERSFSTLRRLKNYMRSTMTESRLNGLALLNIHKEKQIDNDNR